MRLIDADALKDNLCLTDGWGYVVTLQDINDAPTIDDDTLMAYLLTGEEGKVKFPIKQSHGDLISRADAIEAVMSADPKDNEYHYYKHIAVKVLNALPSAEATGALDDAIAKYVADGYMLPPSADAEWIPCSERLPEKGEVVLITNGKGNVRCGQYRSEHDVRDGMHYWWWKGKTVESVLAWMPLPAPYKGGDSK